jgi:Mg2+ and Co2+ transporter CorA
MVAEMGEGRIEIVREFEPERIERMRREGQFFWADLDVEHTKADIDKIAAAFEIEPEDAEPLRDFTRGGSPARRIHVGDSLIVFPFWCAAHPDAPPAQDPGLFRVNVLLHGDFLQTVHRRHFDLPAAAGLRRIPSGRTERYAVYAALDGMANTVLETVSTTELAIGEIERQLLGGGMRPRPEDNALVRQLRTRLTDLRFRVGPERALFERVGEEIEHIETLEGPHGQYFDRILAQLDRTVDRIDAASQALSQALAIQLNETTYRLTLIANVFLPLTFIVGFFGMNFAWMVDSVDTKTAFLIWGFGTWVVPLVAGLIYVRVRDAARRARLNEHHS